MIAQFHYDEETFERFLHDQLDANRENITTHIESCSQCQSHIEDMVEDSLSWAEVADVLGQRKTSVDDGHAVNAAQRFLATSDHPNSIGRFARYEIMEILGRGGMGIVMRALDTSLGRQCAVKVLSPGLASSAAARNRFSREAKSAAAVVHPHVVPIQTVDEHEGLPYLVMPVVEGQSLQQRVENDGALAVVEAVRIAAQVAAGLAAAHDQGLVHRDIKPANVLLENGVERVQITDFGLARAVDDASMTRSGVIAGTPQYMSPEQAHGDSIDHRSDLFSLGSLIYFSLSGHSPFRSETTMGVLNRIINDDPRSIRSTNADVPQWLDRIVCKLLSKSPEDRFATASEVNELLQDWHAHLQQPELIAAPELESQVNQVVPGGNSRNWIPPWAWLAVAAGVLFSGYAGTIIFLQTGNGTLRIESNANADVEIAIRREDSFVKQATVSSNGESFELKSGQYSIELIGKDSSLSIDGDTYELQRGGEWIAKIQQQKGESAMVAKAEEQVQADQTFKKPTFKDLPANTEAHAVGCYLSKLYIGKPDSVEFAPLKVNVVSTGKPMVIVLTSYFSTEWVLEVDPDADVRGVLLSGYHDQRVSFNNGQDIPAIKSTYFPLRSNKPEQKWNRESFFFIYSPLDLEYFAKMQRGVKELAGRSITTFQSVVRGEEFLIDGEKGMEELQIAKRWESFSNNCDEADPSYRMIKKNLEWLASERSESHDLQEVSSEMDRCKVPRLNKINEVEEADKRKQTLQPQSKILHPILHNFTPTEYRHHIKNARLKNKRVEEMWGGLLQELSDKEAEGKAADSSKNEKVYQGLREEQLISARDDLQFIEQGLIAKTKLLRQTKELAKKNVELAKTGLDSARRKVNRGSESSQVMNQEKLKVNEANEKLLVVEHALKAYEAVAAEFGMTAKQAPLVP